MKSDSASQMRTFLYGGGATLLLFDVFFLFKAVFTDNFVPIIPIIAGIFTAFGLLIVVYYEQQTRLLDKKEHRRISRVAHQLTAPLQALETNMEELSAQAQSLPAELRLKLRHMDTKTKVLLDNIRDVFLMLQAQEHPVSQEIRTYDLCSLLKDVISDCQPLAKARNVNLVYQTHCEYAPVKVDRRHFFLAMTHLIDNATIYTMNPGIVNVAVLKNHKHIRIVVQDRGIGISPEDASQVFLPFARGQNAAKYDPDGIGVGLTISRLLLREFNGKLIWRNRHPGMGTEFQITLPLVRSSSKSKA